MAGRKKADCKPERKVQRALDGGVYARDRMTCQEARTREERRGIGGAERL